MHTPPNTAWAPPPQAVLGAPPPTWQQPAPHAPHQPYSVAVPQQPLYGGEGVHRRGPPEGLEGGMAFSADAIAKIGQIGLSTYGEKMLGAGHSFVQQNYAKFVTNGNELRYYFTVNGRYVRNKLKLLLFPFSLRGHWNRSLEQTGGGGPKYRPPVSDINAPDLYIPLMALFSYCLCCCVADISSSPSRFAPERLGRFLWWACAAWASEALLLWVGLKSLATAQAAVHVPLLDLLAYAGYAFVPIALQCALALFSRRAYYAALLWGGLCTAVFMVKTMKRIVYAEARQYSADSHRRNYLLLGLALLQLPFAYWLGHFPSR